MEASAFPPHPLASFQRGCAPGDYQEEREGREDVDNVSVREGSQKKICFLFGIAQITSPPPSPNSGKLVHFCETQKNTDLNNISGLKLKM